MKKPIKKKAETQESGITDTMRMDLLVGLEVEIRQPVNGVRHVLLVSERSSPAGASYVSSLRAQIDALIIEGQPHARRRALPEFFDARNPEMSQLLHQARLKLTRPQTPSRGDQVVAFGYDPAHPELGRVVVVGTLVSCSRPVSGCRITYDIQDIFNRRVYSAPRLDMWRTKKLPKVKNQLPRTPQLVAFLYSVIEGRCFR